MHFVKFALLSCLSLASAPEDVDDADVQVLTDASFKDFVAKNALSLIEFYAPWCGHCKQLKPEYAKAATELLPKVLLAKVDCTVEKKTCEEFGVQGFPTLKIFRDGKASDYQGQRTAASIIETMKRQQLPAFTVLKSADKVKEFSKSEKVVVVGYFNKDASKERKVFEKVAKTLRDDFVFGIAEDEESLKAEKVKDGKGLVLFKKFDEKKAVFDGKFTEEALTDFINKKSTPVMDDIGPSNYDKYLKTGLPIAYFFYGTPEERATLGPAFEKVAKQYQGKIIFVYLDASQFGAHADNIGLKQEWPAFGIHLAKKQEKYPFDQSEKLTEESIAKFVKKFEAGEMTSFMKSQPIPETNDEDVKVIVGKSFEQIAMDEEKDVFVEFYAPWCGHCKKLAPIWEELAEKVKHDKIVIAKMDAASNDAPSVEIQGFPTIILFKAKDNTKITFSGDRSVGGFYDFLVENAVYGKELGELPVKKEVVEEEGEDHDEEL